MNKLIALLKQHEGYRGKPYRDTTGHLTIGYGRNLDARPLSEDEATYLLVQDLEATHQDLRRRQPLLDHLDDVRAAALVDMAFNLGVPGLLRFRDLWAALAAGDWPGAAAAALNSRWARQVGGRATRIAHMLRYGTWPDAGPDAGG